uniref:Initiation-specific alpha-1,6-mannosyltransferase n=1 Tax=Talaromyces marneffei PM1 TaxID=1077442 RepID=A0A093VN78_TALMA
MKTGRPARVFIAVIISFVVLHFLVAAGFGQNFKFPSFSSLSPPTTPATPTTPNRHGIPEKIWHTAKEDHVTERQQEWLDSWIKVNPSMRQELLTDRSSETFQLSIPILRADLLRYLIILAEGGYWSDLDVSCDKKVAEWIPAEYRNSEIDLVVGLEFDFEYRGPNVEVASQFCNWVFMAPPSSRSLQITVDAIVANLTQIAFKNGVDVRDITMDMLPQDVVNITGPKIMTISILDGLSKLLGRTVDDRDFSGIKHPKLVGDVLIMPGVSFAAMQNGFPTDQGDHLVTHHYEGSWKHADAEAKEKKKQQEGGNA